MQKTVYVKDDDEKLFDQVEAMGGGRSVSSIITEALQWWIRAQGNANRLQTLADQGEAYLDNVQEATEAEIAQALNAEEGEVQKALKRANRQARQHIAQSYRTNTWFEVSYPVEAGFGRWELAFKSSSDEDEDADED